MEEQTEALKLAENPTILGGRSQSLSEIKTGADKLLQRQTSKLTLKTIIKKKNKVISSDGSLLKHSNTVPKITPKTITKKIIKRRKVITTKSEQDK